MAMLPEEALQMSTALSDVPAAPSPDPNDLAVFGDTDPTLSALNILAAQIVGPQLEPHLQAQIAQVVASGNSNDIVNNLKNILAAQQQTQPSRSFFAGADAAPPLVGDLPVADLQLAQQANLAAALGKYTEQAFGSSTQAAAAAAVARQQLIDSTFGADPSVFLQPPLGAVGRKRKNKDGTEEEDDEGAGSKSRRKGGDNEKRERMRCWNCSPDCPNRGAGPERHYVAGMCGRCHQRWIKHSESRWSVSVCVSKCRCDRCDYHRAMFCKPEGDAAPSANAAGLELKVFNGGVVAAEKVSVKTLLHDNIDVLLRSENPTMASVLALFSVVGSELSSYDSVDATASSLEHPDPDWPGMVIIPGGTHGLGLITTCNEYAADVFGANLRGLCLHRTALPKASVLPFIAAYLKVSLGKPPQQLVVAFKTITCTEMTVALKLQFTPNHELCIWLKRLAVPAPSPMPAPPAEPHVLPALDDQPAHPAPLVPMPSAAPHGADVQPQPGPTAAPTATAHPGPVPHPHEPPPPLAAQAMPPPALQHLDRLGSPGPDHQNHHPPAALAVETAEVSAMPDVVSVTEHELADPPPSHTTALDS